MTDMRIVKVVVDGKLPEMCHDCPMIRAHRFMGTGRIWYECFLVDGKTFDDKLAPPPTWCPLVKQKDGE